ncbi:chromate efflux transporter [Thalassotalea sp. LPB0316]|uniref:chromate efflux transporter n=1 Tax=Thalassotalea sp. LPB0316 TaxID=2769490 RepID=UPI001867C650|nr:chromate efflux transporter [Thalassotalea sp. LPB0316]QOL26445.1 chromate efflux transporter [Thalassotalea sp. LPB0316]
MKQYLDIFVNFFTLGLISFGGPAAHIGYFNHKFVQKLGWLSQQEYGQLVALSQFLPGPGSSQVGFALGYKRAGVIGGFTAFIAFTMPSVVLMLLLASLSQLWVDNVLFFGVVHGLKLLAVVVVADAVLTMFTSFCQCQRTKSIAVIAALFLLVVSGIASQMLVIVVAALWGAKFLASEALLQNRKVDVRFKLDWLPFGLFILLFVGLPVIASSSNIASIFADFYYAGSLVFGGGHVVLPLLQELLADTLSTDTFLTGYAAAQAVPGPMFTLATFLGFHLAPEAPILGALTATIAIFLPGFLLMLAFLKYWQTIAQMPKLSGAIQGVNAAVVGLLFSALYQPLFTSAVVSAQDMAMVVLGYFLLKQVRLPIVYLVLGFAATGALVAWL